MTLQEQILAVAEARRRVVDCKTVKVALYSEWLYAHRNLLAALAHEEFDCKAAEDALRGLTLATFQETGNKAPAPGVGIREITELRYDPQIAFKWAGKHSLALALDVKAFEKIARVSLPEFVEVVVRYQATIATDLDGVLKATQRKLEDNHNDR